MKIVTCSACKQDIVWLKTKAGKSMPVDAETVGQDDSEFDYTKHISHFASCPSANSFRKKK